MSFLQKLFSLFRGGTEEPSYTKGTRAVLGFRRYPTHPVFELSSDIIWIQRTSDKRLVRRIAMPDIVNLRLLAVKEGDIIFFIEPNAPETPDILLEWDEHLKTYNYKGRPLANTDVFTSYGSQFVYRKL